MSDGVTLVVPTIGRPSLAVLVRALASQSARVESPVLVVDDRRGGEDLAASLTTDEGDGLALRVLRSGGGGPARARNLGWRHARTRWVAFLDDDVVPDAAWYADLLADVAAAEDSGALGSQGDLAVPLPSDRAPTDWERGTAGLQTARWITADIAYKRSALAAVGGFDERFPRAFREDADLALRLRADQGTVIRGARRIRHPVRPADDWVSVRQQAGNADDQLMRVLHGRGWHRRAEAAVGRRARHAAITGCALAAAGGLVAGRRTLTGLGALGWVMGTAEFAWSRISPGPRDADEVRRMLLTSAAIPPVAMFHAAKGALAARHAAPWRGLPDLVLLDRDGTLVHDVPYNGDPDLVRPVSGARAALDRLRDQGIRLAVVSNQSGIARGCVSTEQVAAVNRRVAELLGPFEAFLICPHSPEDGCACRKPAPGMVKSACVRFDVDPSRCVLVGDIGADLEAAAAAGASGILVPTSQTRSEEVWAAPRAARSLPEAVEAILRGDW